jgi:hypothetical protein
MRSGSPHECMWVWLVKMASSLGSKVSGSLLGLAVCDAVGTAVEFMSPGSFQPVVGMTGGGPFRLQPGQVSQLCNCHQHPN